MNQGTLPLSLLALQNLPFPSGPSRQRSLRTATCCFSFLHAATAAAPRLFRGPVTASTPPAEVTDGGAARWAPGAEGR